MHLNKKKIINDPIYGFISIQHEILFDLIAHPYFQRLRRIKQLGLSHLVYPGALHNRFQHALGAMHLMSKAMESLRSKGVDISTEEEKAVLIAILLHDIGHGPFSHSLEHSLLRDVKHEAISLRMMEDLNTQFNGELSMAIDVFQGKHKKNFLHQLVSGQLDMDRLDYLRRDSFYTGVSEGTIGIERIIQMLNVHDDELVVDEKGVFSIEKFIMARRFMYWQVYLHKTCIAADQLMLSILNRAKDLITDGAVLFGSPALLYFLTKDISVQGLNNDPEVLSKFSKLDDNDIVSAIKVWQSHEDTVLSTLCSMLINRHLPKIEIRNQEVEPSEIENLVGKSAQKLKITEKEASYFVYSGEMSNSTYSSKSEQIKIRYKNGKVIDIADASETYGLSENKKAMVKYFISYPK